MSTNTQNTSALLLYQVGPVHCCAPSQTVRAVIEPPPFTRTPGSSERRPGIFRYNRQIIPVTDLRVGFGVEPQQRQKPGRLIIVDFGDRATGFWVDGIHNVVAWPGKGWGPLPALLPRGIFTRTLQLNDRIHLYAEFAQLDRLQTDGYLRDYIQHLEQQGQEDAAVLRPQSSSSTARKSVAMTDIRAGSPAGIPAQHRPAATKPLSLTPSHVASNDAGPDRGVPEGETLTDSGTDAHAAAPKTAGRREPDLPTSRRIESGSDPASGMSETRSRTAAKRNQARFFERTVPSSGAMGPSSRPGAPSTPEPGAKPASIPRRSPTSNSPPTAPAGVTGSKVVSEAASIPAPTQTQARSPTPQRNDELPNPVPSSPNRQRAPSVTPHPAPREVVRRRHTESDDAGSPVVPLLLLLTLIAGVGAGIWYGLAPDRAAPRRDPAPLATKPISEPDTPPPTAASRDRDPAEFSIDQRSAADQISDAIGSDALTGTENTGEDNRGSNWAHNPQDDGTIHAGSAGESETENTAHGKLEDEVAAGPTPPPTGPAHGEDKTSAKTESPAEPPLPHPAGAPLDPYEAEIRRDETGITIVLTTPQDLAVFKDVPKPPAETDQAEPASATARLPENLPDKPAEESTDRPVEDQADKPIVLPPTDDLVPQQRVTHEIVHLVVKGDTLWHIAQRYVNDPFRYPELARLSNIKNPDLIYPGDRVRIIHTVKAPNAAAGGR